MGVPWEKDAGVTELLFSLEAWEKDAGNTEPLLCTLQHVLQLQAGGVRSLPGLQ